MANQSHLLDRMFNALSDSTRRAIVMRLCEGEATVGELAQPFDIALPSLMKHIRVLENTGLVVSVKNGRIRTCAIEVNAFEPVETWLKTQRAIWEQRLDRMESYVANMKSQERLHVGKRNSK